jgi:hypothetical protein
LPYPVSLSWNALCNTTATSPPLVFFFYSECFSYTHIHLAHSQLRRVAGRSLLSGSTALRNVSLANNGSKLPPKSVVANAMLCARHFSKQHIQSVFYGNIQ